MRTTSLSLVILLASASLPAQVKLGELPGPAGKPALKMGALVKFGDSPTVLISSAASVGCPIGITAERRAVPAVSITRHARTGPAPQGIRLGFYHLLTPNIENVTVIVHGLSGKAQLMSTTSAITTDAEETFQLSRAAYATSLTASYLRPRRVSTTLWIELTSVEYTDGSNLARLKRRPMHRNSEQLRSNLRTLMSRYTTKYFACG